MKLHVYFHDFPPQTNPNPFRPKSTWTPPRNREPTLDTFLDVVEEGILKITPQTVREKVTERERQARKLTKQISNSYHHGQRLIHKRMLHKRMLTTAE